MFVVDGFECLYEPIGNIFSVAIWKWQVRQRAVNYRPQWLLQSRTREPYPEGATQEPGRGKGPADHGLVAMPLHTLGGVGFFPLLELFQVRGRRHVWVTYRAMALCWYVAIYPCLRVVEQALSIVCTYVPNGSSEYPSLSGVCGMGAGNSPCCGLYCSSGRFLCSSGATTPVSVGVWLGETTSPICVQDTLGAGQ